jgi:hypothetical protein
MGSLRYGWFHFEQAVNNNNRKFGSQFARGPGIRSKVEALPLKRMENDMSKKLGIILLGMLTALAGTSVGYGAIINLKSGSLVFLKGETQVNVEYSYEGMSVGKFANERDYLDKKTAEYNQKEDGRGDRWRQSWVDDRAQKFQPKFEELLNRHLADRKSNLKFGNFKDAKYTLIFKTTFTEPGWNVTIMRRPALIDGEAVFVETQNRANPLATLTITKSPGRDFMGYDYETAYRIQEAYAKAGKELGIFISKKVK